MKKQFIFILIFHSLCLSFSQAQNTFPFTEESWNFLGGKTVEWEGNQSYMGNAMLKDVTFKNGSIEFDLYVTGARSFPGVFFRMQGNSNYELFYIRPHKLDGLNNDALQYTPVYHNVSCWQLYHGEGYTREVKMPVKQWVHFRLEILDEQGRVFIDHNEQPALVIHHFELPETEGALGVYGPANGTAYFANFQFSTDPPKWKSESVLKPKTTGVFKNWEITDPITNNLVNPVSYPNLSEVSWKSVTSDDTGLINLTRELMRNPVQPGWTIAKTSIVADKAMQKRIAIGYSDFITIFLNGEAVFTGNSAFRSRDPNFSGVIGYNDEVFLNCCEGENELLLLVGENMGGWGFMVKDAEAIYQHPALEKQWELAYQLDYPESIEYDPQTGVLYASNNLKKPTESIAKISINGELINKDWVTGLVAPTGIVLVNRQLHVAERRNVAIIDIDKGEIVHRIPLPGAVFPNDITANKDGSKIWVSDSGGNKIYLIENGEVSVWSNDDDLLQPNGLLFRGEHLLAGCSGYPALVEIDEETREMHALIQLFPGAVMDGIQCLPNGDILFSDWNGSLYFLSQGSAPIELLNTRNRGIQLADFRYISELNLLIIPSLYDNRIMAFKLFPEQIR